MPVKLLDRAAAAEVAARGLSPSGRAPSDWRSGERSRTYSPPGKKRSPVLPGDGMQGPEYPSWWGDGDEWRSSAGGAPTSPHRDGGRSRSAPRPGRRRPRLAYSVQMEPGSQAQPLWRNDLVTSRYLDVPSSGYGRPASPPPVPPQYMPPPPQQQQQPQYPGYVAADPYPALGGGPAAPLPPPGVSGPFQPPYGFSDPYGGGGGAPGPQLYVVQPTGAVAPANAAAAAAMWGHPPPPPQQQQAAAQVRGRDAGGPGWKPIRTAKGASSRIREQVQADKAAARARREARQRAVEATLVPARPARLQQPQEGAWSAPSVAASASPRSPGGGPSGIADSLAANPFTAWFIAPPQPAGQQQLQQQQQPHEAQQQPQQELQRPPTPAVGPSQQQQQQQQQQPVHQGWAEPQRTATPQAPAASEAGAAPPPPPPPQSTYPSWPNTPHPAPTFFPQVFSAGGGDGYVGGGGQSQSQAHAQGAPRGGGGAYPVMAPAPSGLASSPSSSYNPYSARSQQYGSDAGGLYQTRRVGWVDGPQAAPPQGVAPGWLGGPTAWEGPWQQPQPQPQQFQPQQPQQQQQRPPSGQWLMGQQGPWSGPAAAGNPSAGAGAAGRGWGDQAGWLGAGAGAASWAPRPQLSPRAEALRAVRPEVVQWSKSWVGDFGHLDERRFPPSAAAGTAGAGGGAGAARRQTQQDDAESGLGAAWGNKRTDAGVAAGGGGGGWGRHDAAEDARQLIPEQQQQQPQQQRGLPSALAAADALLAAATTGAGAGAAAMEAQPAAAGPPPGSYGSAGGSAVQAFSRPHAESVAARRPHQELQHETGGTSSAAMAAAVAAATAGPGRDRDVTEAVAALNALLSGGSADGGAGAAAGGDRDGAAPERVWGGVLGQVSRLGRSGEVEIGSAWVASEGETPVALGAGGVKWDFDKIVGSPGGLTYQ